ncbi:MAG: tetratricopeptide repeat protein [Planctomycetota bacterium]|jgi:hypothetical protein
MSFSARLLARSVAAAGAVVALLAPVALGAGGPQLQYGKYLSLDDAEKQKLVKRYVKKDAEGFWAVTVSKYEVRTKVSEEFTLRMAFLMDDFHAKFSSIFKGRFARKHRPKLYVLPDIDSYRAFIRSRGADPVFSVGMYMSRGTVLVARYSKDDRRLQNILFHEGTHQLLHAYTGRSGLPVWFNEGCATNFETWDLTYTAAENVRLSVLRSRRRGVAAKAARGGSAHKLAKLLGITSREWSASQNPGLNYAMAWSLTNYLLSTERGRGNFNMILAAVYRGKPLQKLFTPQVKNMLEQMWYEDMKTRMALYDQFIGPAWNEAGRKRFDRALELAGRGVEGHPKLADARFWRGRVLVAAGRYGDALKDLTFAEKADREFPRIQAELGRACLETGDRTKAESWLRKAVKRNPADLASAALLEELQGGR